MKPISQPCLRNQEPIFQALQHVFESEGRVLELACGTAQHAVYMCQRLPQLNWLATDLAQNIGGANMWIQEAGLDNLKPAINLDINDPRWNIETVDYIYSANLVHFVSMNSVNNMFKGMDKCLRSKGKLALYGPYNQNGYTSEGNAMLDTWLKTEINKEAGIKELKDIEALANSYNFQLQKNIVMPANNRLLIFEKQSH
jgi:cyclopropane fatty-acyl-phospholipid synthase-like methyltransferase